MPVRTRYISPQIETMLGFPVSDWLGPDFFISRLHPDDREHVLAEVARTHEKGEDFRMEYRLISADGTAIWVLDQTVAVRDEEYRPLFLQGYLSDITDRRASEEALRQSEETHRLVLEASRDLIATVGADGTVTYASPGDRVAARLHLERARGQGAGRDRPSRGRAVGGGVLRAAGRRASRRPGFMSARARHKNGMWVTLEGTVSAVAGPDGTPEQFVCVARAVPRPALRPAAA